MARVSFDIVGVPEAEGWLTGDDAVMGGVSKGKVLPTGDSGLLFWGSLSLENYGGFASVRSRPGPFKLTLYDTLACKKR